jgi:predicted phage terminase large subunit-like protein
MRLHDKSLAEIFSQNINRLRSVRIAISGFRTNKIRQCQRGRPTDLSVSDSDDSERSRPDTETATIENGFVWLPEAAPWLAAYLAEFAACPRGRHNDQVDSTAQAPAWTKLHLSQSIINLICTAITAIRLCNGARRAPLLPCAAASCRRR